MSTVYPYTTIIKDESLGEGREFFRYHMDDSTYIDVYELSKLEIEAYRDKKKDLGSFYSHYESNWRELINLCRKNMDKIRVYPTRIIRSKRAFDGQIKEVLLISFAISGYGVGSTPVSYSVIVGKEQVPVFAAIFDKEKEEWQYNAVKELKDVYTLEYTPELVTKIINSVGYIERKIQKINDDKTIDVFDDPDFATAKFEELHRAALLGVSVAMLRNASIPATLNDPTRKRNV